VLQAVQPQVAAEDELDECAAEHRFSGVGEGEAERHRHRLRLEDCVEDQIGRHPADDEGGPAPRRRAREHGEVDAAGRPQVDEVRVVGRQRAAEERCNQVRERKQHRVAEGFEHEGEGGPRHELSF
jgi:hypothetical protein